MSLPWPGDGFRWRPTAAGPALVCERLAAVAPHLFTTRGWRLGSSRDEAAWGEVAGALEVGAARLIRLHQVHGAAVVTRRAGDRDAPPAPPDADAVVSADPDAAVAIQTADCVPLLVADRRTGAVAAVHGGWRGTALGVAVETVAAMGRDFGSRPADLVAAIGPAIGACCYEVGGEVRERFAAAGFRRARLDAWFRSCPPAFAGNPPMPGLPSPPRAGHWYFDGAAATRDQLVDAGIPVAQIHVARLCTASHPDLLCSYRREGRGAGRLAAVIRARPR